MDISTNIYNNNVDLFNLLEICFSAVMKQKSEGRMANVDQCMDKNCSNAHDGGYICTRIIQNDVNGTDMNLLQEGLEIRRRYLKQISLGQGLFPTAKSTP